MACEATDTFIGSTFTRVDLPHGVTKAVLAPLDTAVTRLTRLLDDLAGAEAVKTTGRNTRLEDLPDGVWVGFDAGVASELVAWVEGGRRRARSRQSASRHTQLQRWFARFCARHRDAGQRLLAVLRAVLRVYRRAVHRQRLRLHRRAVRAMASEHPRDDARVRASSGRPLGARDGVARGLVRAANHPARAHGTPGPPAVRARGRHDPVRTRAGEA